MCHFVHKYPAYLAIASRAIPVEPTRTPACNMAQGRAKLPDPILDLTKLKNVAILLQAKIRGEKVTYALVPRAYRLAEGEGMQLL